METKDNINPDHYKSKSKETIERLQDNLTQGEFKGYLKGNILKYLDRYEHKNGVEDLNKIFNSFYRSDVSNHPEIKGTGLGLSIVKRLCDILNFNIEVFKTKHRFTFKHYSYLITWHGKRIFFSGDTESAETIARVKGINWALNYYFTTGGNNTSIRWYENDNVVAETLSIEPNKWCLLNVNQLHDVRGIEEGQIRYFLTLDILDNNIENFKSVIDQNTVIEKK
jgi:hypothetical protein